MPLYDIELLVRGEVVGIVSLPLAVEDRDKVKLRRSPLPRSIAISGAAQDPGESAYSTLTAYKRIEQRMGNTSEFRRRIGHSPEQVKRAWASS